MRTCLLVFTGLLLASTAPLDAITRGQKDTFADGTTQGWAEGLGSPNPPANIASGGPQGAADRYLQNVSSGGFGAGSKMIMFNQAQWLGDYTAAGVTRVVADMANFGATPLNMRIGLKRDFDFYVSANAVTLPADGQWHHVAFNLSAAGMSQVGGTNPLSTVLGAVQEVRILSNTFAEYNGETIAGTLGVDNLTATVPGDCNADGRVNVFDLQIMAASWNKQQGDPGYDPRADFTGDNKVNVFDLSVMAQNWNT